MLDPILQSTRSRVVALRLRNDEIEAAAAGLDAPRDFIGALSAPGLSVIAEVKRRSPSAGSIAPDLDPAQLGSAYERGGAAAISVLTEPDHFGGSLEDLREIGVATSIPVLRKDFILDPLQIDEARAAGADAVLLIAAILSDQVLAGLIDHVSRFGMAALVEAHDSEELRRAIDLGAEVVGVNNRDLASFEVDLETSIRLRTQIPSSVIAVAESGINSPQDARRMYDAGFDAVLVGTAAARADDPAAFVAGLGQPA
ncbi:MAG: indole-3-glycerol phosphate synthase TrpC [Acidobacteria bacterium]|nr:indole-3-glycerol phosphate synthase TrpC [Acidobacteriota bacterium]